jgi:hypothetical protein
VRTICGINNKNYQVIADSYKNQDKLDIPEKVKVVRYLPESNFEHYKETVDKLEFNLFDKKFTKT